MCRKSTVYADGYKAYQNINESKVVLGKRNTWSEANLVPMLLGEAGIGKSSWVEALAESEHTKCFTLPCNQLADKADLTGARLVPDDKGGYMQVFYPHEVIMSAIHYALENPRQRPILFLDEINRTTADTTSALLSIPTLRRIGSISLPKNLRVIIAGNHKGNVVMLDEASITRFVLYRVEPDVNTFMSINNNLNQFVLRVLQAHPKAILCKKSAIQTTDKDNPNVDVDIDDLILENEEMSQMTVPRTVTAVSDWLNLFSQDDLLAAISATTIRDSDQSEISVLQEGIEGHVGETEFAILLLSEIVNNINSLQVSNISSTKIGKPQCYDDLKTLKSRSDLDAYVQTLSEIDKSGCLLYALYERQDNTAIIQALSASLTKMTGYDLRSLMILIGQDDLDGGNRQAFVDTKSVVAQQLSIMLEQ